MNAAFTIPLNYYWVFMINVYNVYYINGHYILYINRTKYQNKHDLCIVTFFWVLLLWYHCYLLDMVVYYKHQLHLLVYYINAPFNFGDWPFGMILIFLNKSCLATSTLSSLWISQNSFGSSQTSSILAIAWHEIQFLSNFSIQVLYMWKLPSNGETRLNTSLEIAQNLFLLNKPTNLLYRQWLQTTHLIWPRINKFLKHRNLGAKSWHFIICIKI